MKKKFLLKNSCKGDALITTIVVLMIMAVFLLGYLNIASKRIEAHVNFNKYVDMKTSMANAIHAALVVAINNYDNLSAVATELENLDDDENLKAVFSDIAKHYPFLNESSPTIFSDLQYSETMEASESLFKTAYGYPSVYYLKMNEKYEDVIISTIKDENGRIMNYLLGLVEKYPFFDELRKKVYIINDTSSDPNKKSRFLPEEEFLGALMTQGILFFNKSRGQGNQQYDYGTLYFSVTDDSRPFEIPPEAFLEFLSDFNHTIVASGSEFLWVGPGNNSTSTMTIDSIDDLFAGDSTYSYVYYSWNLGHYKESDLATNTEDPEAIWTKIEETNCSTIATLDVETGLSFDCEDYSPEIESRVDGNYTIITINNLKKRGNRTEKEKLYEIKILPIANSTNLIYTEMATIDKFDEDGTVTNRLVLSNFNGTLYFDIEATNTKDLIINGDSTNYSNADLKIITNDSIKFEQSFLINGLDDISTDVQLSLNDPILSFVASDCIKFQKTDNGKSDETYEIAGSLYALNGALVYIGNGNGDLNLSVYGQVLEGISVEHLGQGWGSGAKRNTPDVDSNDFVSGGGNLKNNIYRHFYYDPRLWFVDYFKEENIKRIFIPKYEINDTINRILDFKGSYGSVIVRLNYMGW